MSLEDHLVKRFRGRSHLAITYDLDSFMPRWEVAGGSVQAVTGPLGDSVGTARPVW